MPYPNVTFWSALRSGPVVVEGVRLTLRTIDCGRLNLASGQLLACDPFAGMSKTGPRPLSVPRGRHPVTVTVADVSKSQDGSHLREAYASIIFGDLRKATRRAIVNPSEDGTIDEAVMDAAGTYWGFGVDAGTACFADADAIKECMPDESTWYEAVFDNGEQNSWFGLMDDPDHIAYGLANIALPHCEDRNIVIIHSGWGDGFYPVVGEFDATGALLALHIDFMVLFDEDEAVEQ